VPWSASASGRRIALIPATRGAPRGRGRAP
jgi:hypothetical protein